jgi:hypothetical protein
MPSYAVQLDLDRKTFTPVAELNAGTGVLSPDGSQIAYTVPPSMAAAELRAAPIGNPSATRLLAADRDVGSFAVFGWTVKDEVIFVKMVTLTRHNLWRKPSRDAPAVIVRDGPSRIADAAASPDGEWVAYGDDVSGQFEVYIERLTRPGQRWQVSIRGGGHPRWHPRQSELFFVALDGTLMAVTVTLGDQPSLGLPRPLFRTALRAAGGGSPPYAAITGERFLMAEVVRDERVVAPMSVIVNHRAPAR